jgi:hypothetical protein
VREVTFQIGVGVKAGVEIGRDQECVASDPHEGIEYFCLRGTRPEECTFNIYIRRINCVLINRQFRIKVACDGSARSSPPEIATNSASLGLKQLEIEIQFRIKGGTAYALTGTP